ncbi:universal stress protein [Rhodobacteraceae bacterium LMO-12]|nr:universal stress protein [Rhodobacteraceae bacterium LMO-JJ12]
MKKIMLATDFSERSDRALRRATLLARQFEAALLIVHVVDDDQPRRIVESERDVASTLLRELRDTVQDIDGIPCETRVVLADPFAGIARAAEEVAPDLLVIGPHRRQALRDVFVGTTAERTIRSVACPVLMVNAPPVGPYGHVMLTTDFSEGSTRAAKTCIGLGIARDARATMLHVFDAPAVHLAMSHTVPVDERQAYIDDERREASRNLAAFMKSLDWQSLRPDVRQVRKSRVEDILAAAREASADLVVIGTHGRGNLAKLILGSVAEAVLRRADRDVLAIPPVIRD